MLISKSILSKNIMWHQTVHNNVYNEKIDGSHLQGVGSRQNAKLLLICRLTTNDPCFISTNFHRLQQFETVKIYSMFEKSLASIKQENWTKILEACNVEIMLLLCCITSQ